MGFRVTPPPRRAIFFPPWFDDGIIPPPPPRAARKKKPPMYTHINACTCTCRHKVTIFWKCAEGVPKAPILDTSE